MRMFRYTHTNALADTSGAIQNSWTGRDSLNWAIQKLAEPRALVHAVFDLAVIGAVTKKPTPPNCAASPRSEVDVKNLELQFAWRKLQVTLRRLPKPKANGWRSNCEGSVLQCIESCLCRINHSLTRQVRKQWKTILTVSGFLAEHKRAWPSLRPELAS